MYRTGEHFLSRPGLSVDQHRGIVVAYPHDLHLDLFHSERLTDQSVGWQTARRLTPQKPSSTIALCNTQYIS